MSNKSVIIDGVRSPIGSKNGEMIGMRPDDIAAQVVKGLLERNKEIKNEEVEDVPKLSGSVLELKYFGDLASEQGGSPASTGNVVSEAKKEKEMDKPLA